MENEQAKPAVVVDTPVFNREAVTALVEKYIAKHKSGALHNKMGDLLPYWKKTENGKQMLTSYAQREPVKILFTGPNGEKLEGTATIQYTLNVIGIKAEGESGASSGVNPKFRNLKTRIKNAGGLSDDEKAELRSLLGEDDSEGEAEPAA